MSITAEQIESAKGQLTLATDAWINGKAATAQSGERFDCVSPIDGSVLASIARCDEADINAAVACAKQKFEAGIWAKLSPCQRKQTLLRLADLIEQNALSLAVMETMDMGKPVSAAYGEVFGAANAARWIAEATDKIYDSIAPTGSETLAMIRREPCGVVGIITPWNFPFYLAVKKLIPALATGNSVVIKPAEQSPLTTLRLGELIQQAGIPDGVVNIVPGFGETAGQALALHRDVDVISFTGSTEVGRLMMQYSGQSNLKRINLECGGKSPNIICADANDLDKAARESAAAVFHNSGQICCAPTRMLVDNRVREQVLKVVMDVAKRYMPANPFEPDTLMGTIVDEVQCKRVMGYIDKGQGSAELCCGGEQLYQETGGYYIAPTVFTGVTNDMVIAQEEVFGPVLSVIGFDTLEEAVAIANDTTYGLAASVWTSNLQTAHRLSASIRAGVVSVNTLNTGDASVTFGGYKQSGIGTEGALYDFDNYSEIKTTWMSLE